MEDKLLPESVGESLPKPLQFPGQKDLCQRLNDFYQISGIQYSASPSSIFCGALYAMRHEYAQENPDWMAQVAHSLREIFYPFQGRNSRSIALEKYGSTYDERKRNQDIGRYYNFITDIAHHNCVKAGQNSLVGGTEDAPVIITRELFEKVVFQFGKVIYAVLRRQIDAHREIDQLLEQSQDKAKLDNLNNLIDLNPDARQYFFAKTDEKWFDWLWRNGFLDIIKGEAEDASSRGNGMPELQYLARIAEKIPIKIVDFMLEVSVSDKTFNPAVVDRFLWICRSLPADQLARMAEKIRRENWIPLMGQANRWFKYDVMFKTLVEAKDCKSILVLSEALLKVRSIEEMGKELAGLRKDNPFYFPDVTETKVFYHLANIDISYAEQALSVAAKTMTEIIQLGGEAKDEAVFPCSDINRFYEVDFFTLQLGQGRRLSYRDDVIELAAVIKILAGRLIGEKCGDGNIALRIYTQYIDSLPQSQVMWRLRLFILSLCPEIFKEELKKVFFRLFEVKQTLYYEIIFGAEYKTALQKSFAVLLDVDKREYVENVIAYFSAKITDPDDQKYNKNEAAQILSTIWEQLAPEEQKKAENLGMGQIPDYKPEPAITGGDGGWVRPKAPVSKEEFEKLTVSDIAAKLRADWSPEKLREQNTSGDFLNPLNAEGVSDLLKGDILRRLQEYVSNAALFYERGALIPHYTYAYFRGISEALRENKVDTGTINWDALVALFIAIKKSAETKAFERKEDGKDNVTWLVGWAPVHSALTDIVQALLVEKDRKIRIDFLPYRDRLFEIVTYLLGYPDPIPEDEQVETAKIKSQVSGSDYLVSDPLTTAINSVRGRTFEAFCHFVYQDGKQFKKTDEVKISSDVKELYEKVLKSENTRALMFMFGHHLASFYYRDKIWIKSLLHEIFPVADNKKHLYLAAWEGYLTATLYVEMFFDPDFQKLYERGLKLAGNEDPGRKYQKNPDEGIAVHLALAFVHFKEFGPDHQLFKNFWTNDDVEQHSAFINFIGRAFISTENAKNNELLEKKPEARRRLGDFWDWLLENYKHPKLFVEFGFWVNSEKPVFDAFWLAARLKETLKKTNGVIDWDCGLSKAIPQLAKDAPGDTLDIVRLFLLEGGVRNKARRLSFYWDEEYFEALKILYANPATKSGTYTLIDDLVREGGSIFWKLKEILR